ncbi:unnamed protein product [Clonostachys rosea f. rosea IK726]|uniref:Uncharacterized protein n=1 Tax=Clonostachys rosea f. rosea IK726 TaxID=1349383 RepID=A0ACA9UBY1_BIOOC|nr:unnamed protein product [Clonostachys rosea f. rosea IK726]
MLDTRSNDEETRNLSLAASTNVSTSFNSCKKCTHPPTMLFISSTLFSETTIVGFKPLHYYECLIGKVEGEWKSRTEPKSMDMGPSQVAVACMYPSPSASGNLDMSSADPEEMNAEDSVSGTVRQQPTPLSNTLESWASAGVAEPCSIQLHHDSIAGASFTDTWCEVDTFLLNL